MSKGEGKSCVADKPFRRLGEFGIQSPPIAHSFLRQTTRLWKLRATPRLETITDARAVATPIPRNHPPPPPTMSASGRVILAGSSASFSSASVIPSSSSRSRQSSRTGVPDLALCFAISAALS